MEAPRPSGRIHMRTGAGLRAEVAAVGWPAWLECRVGWVEMAARGTIAAKPAHAAVRGMSTLGTHDDRVLLPLKDRVIGSVTYLWSLISYPLISLPLFPQRAGRYTSKCFYRRTCYMNWWWCAHFLFFFLNNQTAGNVEENHFGIYSTYYGCENKNKSSIEKIWVQSMLRIMVTETCLVEQRVPPNSIWVYLNTMISFLTWNWRSKKTSLPGWKLNK